MPEHYRCLESDKALTSNGIGFERRSDFTYIVNGLERSDDEIINGGGAVNTQGDKNASRLHFVPSAR